MILFILNRHSALLIIVKSGQSVNILKPIIAASVASLIASVSAQATYSNYWDVEADAGSYGTLALGEDIALDGCGSTFYSTSSGSTITRGRGSQVMEYSLCELSDLTDFTLTWRAFENNKGWYDLAPTFSGSNAENGLEFSVSTGTGTFFDAVGTYMISLYVTVSNSDWIILPNRAGWAYTGYGQNDNYDITDYNGESLVFTSAPVVTVPEPESLFLLIPGLALMALRERRRRRKIAVS
jgi:hypothetical protein